MPSKGGPGQTRNASQVRARRAWVVEKTLAGYSIHDMAVAAGVTESVVAADRMQMRRHLHGMTRKAWRSSRPAEPLEPFDWHNADPVVRDTTYTRMTPVRYVESMLKSLQGDNALNRLAHNISAASMADDRRWLTKTRKTLVSATTYLQAMLEVMDDEEARHRAAHTLDGRDDMRKQADGQKGNIRRFLPPEGAGLLPSPLYGTLWRYRYAGIKLDDAAAIEIAKMLNYRNPEHIGRAVEEFDAAFPMNTGPGSQ